DAEVAGRLVRGIVPELAARLAGERREERPRLAAVLALEDAGRLDADEHAPVPDGERGDLRHLPRVVVAVADAFAREGPGLAEIGAAPDGRGVPVACGSGGVGGATGARDSDADRPARGELPPQLRFSRRRLL